jgi:type II secretory pathway pseudopilin PulG
MKTFLAVFFGILAAVAVILMLAGLVNLWQSREKAKQVEQHIRVLRMRVIATACITYQSTYGGYPETLAQLGPGPGGVGSFTAEHGGLIDEVLASGKVGGYTFTYSPTKRDRRRHVTGYNVSATRDRSDGPYIYNFFVDQTGVIRSTLENRPATSTDQPIID